MQCPSGQLWMQLKWWLVLLGTHAFTCTHTVHACMAADASSYNHACGCAACHRVLNQHEHRKDTERCSCLQCNYPKRSCLHFNFAKVPPTQVPRLQLPLTQFASMQLAPVLQAPMQCVLAVATEGAGHLAMMSGMASLMLAGRALRFLGKPVSPEGNEMDSPWSSTLLALPIVAFMPTLASPNPVFAMALTQFCIKGTAWASCGRCRGVCYANE